VPFYGITPIKGETKMEAQKVLLNPVKMTGSDEDLYKVVVMTEPDVNDLVACYFSVHNQSFTHRFLDSVIQTTLQNGTKMSRIEAENLFGELYYRV
jgi:hypothetical protein